MDDSDVDQRQKRRCRMRTEWERSGNWPLHITDLCAKNGLFWIEDVPLRNVKSIRFHADTGGKHHRTDFLVP